MGRLTTLTRKGQVTIPKAVREEMGLQPFDKIEFYVENHVVTLRKARLSLDEMEGMLPPLGIPIEEMAAIAWDDWAKRYAEREQ